MGHGLPGAATAWCLFSAHDVKIALDMKYDRAGRVIPLLRTEDVDKT